MSSTEDGSCCYLDMEVSEDPSFKKEVCDTWPHEEIVALLSVWKRYVAQLDRTTHKKFIYEKMSEKLQSQLGVTRDRVAVQDMITKMKAMYKKNMPHKPTEKSKWRYWRAVDEILGEPDSEDESAEEELEDMESTEEEVIEVLPAKKTRVRPIKLPQAVAKSTPPKKRKVEKVYKTPRFKKPPPRDEILEKMLAQDKEYDVMLNKLSGLFEDTSRKVLEMQQKSNNNILSLATHLEDYIKSMQGDRNIPNHVDPLANLADNSLVAESPYGVLPTTNTSSQPLVPFLRSIIGQITSQRNDNMMGNHQ